MSTLITDQKIKRETGYGQYVITGKVNGIHVETKTDDSEAFDWFNDDENIEKHEAAVHHVDMKLDMVYEQYYK